MRLPLRRYHTKTDAPQVKHRNFFSLLHIISACSADKGILNLYNFFEINHSILQVALYSQRQEALYTPKLDAFVIPRQNPRKIVTDPAIVNNDDWLGDEVNDELPNHLEIHLPVSNSPTNQNGI